MESAKQTIQFFGKHFVRHEAVLIYQAFTEYYVSGRAKCGTK